MKIDVSADVGLRGKVMSGNQQQGLKPVLKWVGGKGWVADRVRDLFPARVRGTYYEPFFGGGAVFFSLRAEQLPLFDEARRQHVAASRARVADLSSDLVMFYCVLRDDSERLLGQVRELRDFYLTRNSLKERERAYSAVRAVYNDHRGDGSFNVDVNVRQAARYLFLNKTCFNGLMRFNRRGEMNTPHGDYKNPQVFDPDHLRAVSRALRGVDLQVLDFEEAVRGAREGDVVYLDPPHATRSETARFTGYTQRAWTEADDARVSRVFWDLARRGVRVVLSQADTERAAALLEEYGGREFADAEVVRVERPGTVSSKGKGRGPVVEILVAAGPR